MRRLLLLLLSLCIAGIAGGCRNCLAPPVYPQVYAQPACDPCSTGTIVPAPTGVVVSGPPRVVAP